MTKSRGILTPRRRWTPAEIEILRREYPNRLARDLAQVLGCEEYIVYSKATKLGLRKSPEFLASTASGRLRAGDGRGVSGRFQKGHAPWTKGRKFKVGLSPQTQFKKGQRAHNKAEIGALRINSCGYLDRKVRSDRRGALNWTGVHRLVWEAANGPVPPGHAVVFKAGRRTNKLEEINLDALELLTSRELMIRNSYHNRYPKEIGQIIQLRGAVQRQINKRLRAQEIS